jgi:hypothetical protein
MTDRDEQEALWQQQQEERRRLEEERDSDVSLAVATLYGLLMAAAFYVTTVFVFIH